MKCYCFLLGLFLIAHCFDRCALADQSTPKKSATERLTELENSTEELETKTGSGQIAIAIEKVRQQATKIDKLPDATRTEIIELCDKATGKLKDAQGYTAVTAALEKELADLAHNLESLQHSPADSSAEPIAIDELSAVELRSRLSTAEQHLSAAREKVQKTTAEIERRASRRQALPELLTKCRNDLTKATEALKAEVTTDLPLLAEAKRLCRTARREALAMELRSLEQENRTYEATSRLWLARRDAAEKQLQITEAQHKVIKELVVNRQRRDAEHQAREAQRAAVNAHPAVKEAAAKNVELAEKNHVLVSRMQELQGLLVEAREFGQTIKNRLTDVTKRAEAARNSPAIGASLRTQQDQLPNLEPFRERLRTRPVEISQFDLDIWEWESARRETLHVDPAAELASQEVIATASESIQEETVTELRRVFEARAGILAELISNANDCLSQLEELDAAESEIVTTTEQLTSFIAEKVLWVRSAPILSLDDLGYLKSLKGEVATVTNLGKGLSAYLLLDARQRPILWATWVFVVLGLVLGRRKARVLLRTSGEAAVRPTATSFRPTLDASVATIFLAAPIPIVCGFVGWRLCQENGGFSYSLGWAVVLFAAAYAMLNLVRHASRTGGLGTNHFGWDERGLSTIHRSARPIQYFVLPLLALAVGVEVGGGNSDINTLGRLSLIVALLVTGVICFRLFHRTGAFGTALASKATISLGARWGHALAPIAAFAVLLLITASTAGYHYTAMQLTRRVFVSCVFVFACLALRSLLMRWLLLAYRRVAMQLAREKRKALLEAQDQASSENPVVDPEPHVSLSDINQQARKLVGVGTGLAFVTSLWLVWGDLLPALGIFGHVELWPSSVVSVNPDAGLTFVTLTDLIFAVGIFAFTWFAGHNLPGLLEIAVLQKLPLDAGARYAASSVTRYTIMAVGVVLGMRELGVGWQSVQWLVAAMTVGLGFGLQEIFANFVSGIILLFERPARVGDTVTIGAITGTITKIRIRATTIVDWDNKELVVPNKEFVTGNLVNWTLTDANLRLVVGVGVAYGSDTRLVTQLLYRVAEENENVLHEPEPVVIFNEFGDSSLNFELRLFVSDLTMYRRLRHDLHLAIDDLFRKNKVEIAFPQCDLHVRSMPVQSSGALLVPMTSESPDAQNAAA